jgi:hypothetical protein
MEGLPGRDRDRGLRRRSVLSGTALLAIAALVAFGALHRARGPVGSLSTPMTREEVVGLARARAAADRVLGVNVVDDTPGRMWMVEIALDAGKRAEVTIDPGARSVVSYAIRSEPDDAGP